MTAISTLRHGRYVIRIWPDGSAFSGRAMLGDLPILDQYRGATADGVAQEIRRDLDLHRKRMANGRGPPETPTQEEYTEAFLAVNSRISDDMSRMLRALLEAPERTLTATQLAAAAGRDKFTFANRFFGELGKLIALEVGYTPGKRDDETYMWTTSLADAAEPDDPANKGEFRWRMRPEVAQALEGKARIVLVPAMTAKARRSK